ncbi:MAG: hypothetical protein ACKJSG_17635, partial [Lentisphaeria bacterium]
VVPAAAGNDETGEGEDEEIFHVRLHCVFSSVFLLDKPVMLTGAIYYTAAGSSVSCARVIKYQSKHAWFRGPLDVFNAARMAEATPLEAADPADVMGPNRKGQVHRSCTGA